MAYGQALMPFKICGLRCALNHKEPPEMPWPVMAYSKNLNTTYPQ